VWQGCRAGQSGTYCTIGEWALNFTWQDAQVYCDNLDWGAEIDWRLPDIKEFVSIVDYRVSEPSIDMAYFPYPNFDGSHGWTSTYYTHLFMERSWAVGWWAEGDVVASEGTIWSMTFQVWCVRDGP
jgi:uncharacterized protein DUF1566